LNPACRTALSVSDSGDERRGYYFASAARKRDFFVVT
jgi:hypothetical protein